MTRSPLHVLCLAAALALAASPARAHIELIPVGGKGLKIDTSKDPSKHKVSYKSEKQINIFPLGHDPATDGTAVLIRWTGQAGVGAGRTPLLNLNPFLWKQIGGGYKYNDKAAGAGGIRSVLFKASGAGGALKITAKGEQWFQELAGPHDSVWVHFRIEDEWFCSEFGGDIKKNESGVFQAKKAPLPVACPDAVCGNGVVELGEDCDDGNIVDVDTCANDCTVGDCEQSGGTYDSTFDAIQGIIFESPLYGCSSLVCHGSSPGQGQLDLTAGSSYANLVGVPSFVAPLVDRVEPGDQSLSVLYDKLEAGVNATLPVHGGGAMPVGGALTADHLEAVELWIRGGAPEDLVVEGTAELLNSCLPEPDPLTSPPPDPPGAGVGVQFRQTPWPLPAVFEGEICMSTYYDLTQTNLVPESAKMSCSLGINNNPSGECFLWHKQTLAQDPQSHHSIIHLYTGQHSTSHSGWGNWTRKFQDDTNPQHGQSCSPTSVDAATGYAADCSSDVETSIACIGYGPPDQNAQFQSGFSGSQESFFEQEFADGVYSLLPMSGIIIWNSHAFNTTNGDSTMSQYLNLDLAAPADQVSQLQQIFDADDIFIQNVPPFDTREYCANFVIPQNTNVFDLSSHTHRHGVLFRIWEPPNSNCSSGSCPPGSPGQLVYSSTDYADPARVVFDPPMHFGSVNSNNRRFRFCSLYDNGNAPGSPPVKLNSNPIGTGCGTGVRRCFGGPNEGALCNGLDSVCESSPGAGDGTCDACPVVGGVTTEDEMFIMLGSYYFD